MSVGLTSKDGRLNTCIFLSLLKLTNTVVKGFFFFFSLLFGRESLQHIES